MQDNPTGRMILSEVQAALKTGLAPGFQQAVAANAVALALREDELAPSSQSAEQARLAALLGVSGNPDELNRALAETIRNGTADCTSAELTRHLILSTVEKMAVDQPNYPAFRAWRAASGETR